MIIYSQKYLNKYNQICKHYKELGLQKSKDLYTESHHILPKSMGGLDIKDNLVRIPARVHFLLHWMLYRIYRNSSMAHAWNMMCAPLSSRIISKSYEYARLAQSKVMSGRVISLETRSKMANARKGVTLSDEAKARIGNANRGRICSLETKSKLSAKSKITNLGRSHSSETKAKIASKAKGRTASAETKAKMSAKLREAPIYTCPHCSKIGKGNAMKQYHFDRCKLKM